MPGDETRRVLATVGRWHGRVVGIWLIVASAACGALAWIVLGLIVSIARKQEVAVGGVASWLLAHPAWIVGPAAAGLLCGVLLVVQARLRWLLIALGSLCLAGLVAGALYAFVMVLAPLYEVS